jgi:hypothetical protein
VIAALALVVGLLIWLGEADDQPPPSDHERVPLALFTTLPIYWNEGADVSELLDRSAAPHWARAALEHDFELLPLDVLSQESLAPHLRLFMAQPRALSPAENVALDEWVRGGGRLLLFADPQLTEESRFALGDPRRPADVALLSPILARWGLELSFDPQQPAGERRMWAMGVAVPFAMAGRLAPFESSADRSVDCEVVDAGLVASCTIGRGSALILPDAALLESGAPDPPARSEALARLTELAYAAK